ncbi:hypothetical protein CLOP_g12236, partial [Closterium sp. NIES-67]
LGQQAARPAAHVRCGLQPPWTSLHRTKAAFPLWCTGTAAETASEYDGHPEAWFTQHGDKGPAFRARRYTYPNDQQAATLWYHDHAMGITRLNVAAGMAGLYIVTDPQGAEKHLLKHLPGAGYTVALAISDRRFHANGSIDYPSQGIVPSMHPHWVPEYTGDTILVSGLVWPYMTVRRTRYRFRVLGPPMRASSTCASCALLPPTTQTLHRPSPGMCCPWCRSL